MKSILVPLDGSLLSWCAFPYAARLASRTGAGIILLRASETPDSTPSRRSGRPIPGASGPEETGSAIARELESAAEPLRNQGLSVTINLCRGRLADALLEVAATSAASHVVMAARDGGDLRRMLFGTMADDIARRTPVPVILVTARSQVSDGRALDCILVPLDGSPEAEQVLPAATALANEAAARLLLLRVVEPVPLRARAHAPAATRAYLEESRCEAHAYLNGLVARLRDTVARIDVRVMAGDPARVITALADEQEAAVAMAPAGRGPFGRARLGSVARAVLRHARVPLLLLPPAAVAPAPGGATERAAALGAPDAGVTQAAGAGRWA
jgi:nucleotide-binding universal stress UspA family protein